MSLISSNCQKCGGQIEFDDSKSKSFCVHCGSKIDVKAALQTFKIDNSEKTKNLVSMLEQTIEDKNYKKAETYAEQILEIDQTNARVWYLRGSAIIWQSTLQKNRIQEGVGSYLNAIKILNSFPDTSDFDLLVKIFQDYLNFHTTWFLHVCDHFAKFSWSDNQDQMLMRECDYLLYAYNTIRSQARITIRHNFERVTEKEGNEDLYKKLESQEIRSKNTDLNYLNGKIDLLLLSIEQADDAYEKIEEFNTISDSWDKKKKITMNSYNVISKFSEEDYITKENLIKLHLKEIELRIRLVNLEVHKIGGNTTSLSDEAKQGQREIIKKLEEKIKIIDPTYEPTYEPPQPEKPSDSCYIATMVYGDYEAPQVKVFRGFRDNVLKRNIFGRGFIKVYYYISPKLIAIFGKQKWFNTFWKKLLDTFINRLQ